MYYHFKIHKEDNGYWAECIELDGCRTQADTLKELEVNMSEALNLFLSEPESSKIIFNLPVKNPKISKSIRAVKVVPNVAFAMLIRQTRIQKRMTLDSMAKKLNYKNINTYKKLEVARTSNPELKTIANITNVFSDFPLQLVFS